MLFMPQLITFDDAGQAVSLTKRTGISQKICVVPRSQCVFKRLRLKGKGKPAKLALQIQVQKDVDIADVRTRIEEEKNSDFVGVWAFPSQFGYVGRYLPESLAVTPMQDGVRLVKCLEGVEGQVWKSEALIASRWWPAAPNIRAWSLFLQASNIESDQAEVPAPIALPYRQNLAVFETSQEQLMHVFSPQRLLAASGVIAACVFLFLAGRFINYTTSLSRLENEVAQTSESAQTVLSQRRAALENIVTPLKLYDVGDQGILLTTLYGVSESLDEAGLILSSLSIVNDELEAVFRGETDLSGPDIVTQLEAVPTLSDVNVSFDVRGNLTVNAILVSNKDLETFRLFSERQN